MHHLADDQGAQFFGVADLQSASDFIENQGGSILTQYPRGISVGIRLSDAIVDALVHQQDRTAIYTYTSHYITVNAALDATTLRVSQRLQALGYQAFPIQATRAVDMERHLGTISHKLVAHLAGMGWIGKNCLLITPEHGPRIRLATILTDAPLPVGTSLPDHCGDCTECIDACPVHAFTGVAFDASESREVRYDAHRCWQYLESRKVSLGEGRCGLCILVCPYGHRTRSPQE